MSDNFRLHANDVVRHFKGNLYTIMIMGVKGYEGAEPAVAYVRNCDGTLWLRPYDMFLSEVDRKKYPDVEQTYRMEKVENPSFEDTTIAPYELSSGEHKALEMFKRNGTDEIYILMANNYTHSETKEPVAIFIGINDEIPSYMPYEGFKKIMSVHTVTEDNLSELEVKK